MLGRCMKLRRGFRSICQPSSYNLAKVLINNNEDIEPLLLVNYGKGYFHLTDDFSKHDEKSYTFSKSNIYPPIFLQFPYNFLANGPCNGLYCLYASHGPVALWNPGTGDIKNLTAEEDLPADQEIEIHNLAFGFDSKTNDYKVVRSVTRRFVNPCYKNVDEIIHQIEVYSLKTKQWREIPVLGEMRSYIPCFLSSALFADGACYWSVPRPWKPPKQADEGDDDGDDYVNVGFGVNGSCKLISFDFVEEELHIIPVYHELYYSSKSFLNSGCPAAATTFSFDYPRMDVLARIPVNGVKIWTIQMMVDPYYDDEDRPYYNGNGNVLKPLCVWKNQGLILFDDKRKKLHFYDLRRKKNTKSIAVKESRNPPLQVLNFPECLVPNPW